MGRLQRLPAVCSSRQDLAQSHLLGIFAGPTIRLPNTCAYSLPYRQPGPGFPLFPLDSSTSLMCCILCTRGNAPASPGARSALGAHRVLSEGLSCSASPAGWWLFGKHLAPQRRSCGSQESQMTAPEKCAKLSWRQSTDLIFGMIPLSCRDCLLKSCSLLFLPFVKGNPRSWRNILLIVITKNFTWLPLPQGRQAAGGGMPGFAQDGPLSSWV